MLTHAAGQVFLSFSPSAWHAIRAKMREYNKKEAHENPERLLRILAKTCAAGTPFPCFTGTKVHILTPEELRARAHTVRHEDARLYAAITNIYRFFQWKCRKSHC